MNPALLLAIEPDHRQALQLKSIARRVGAALVLADSIERALDVLTDPLPDLILTPALLSFRDDLALTERLRELGDAAAHIQTLTIPILETPELPERGGMLSVLKRDKAPTGPVGCDAETFAEQIAVYLSEAKARRASTIAQAPAIVDIPPHIVQPAPEIVEPPEAIAEPQTEFIEPEQIAEAAPAIDLLSAIMETPPEVAAPVVCAAPADDMEETLALTAIEAAEEPVAALVETELPEPASWAPASEEPVLDDPPLPVTEEVVFFLEREQTDEPQPRRKKVDWRFFDPGQVRFAALLAKLDEIAAEARPT